MTYPGRDGTRLAYQEVGDGWPVVLLHGRLDRGEEFIESGLVSALTAAGFRSILPDMRGHGRSAKPDDPGSWPADVLTDDALALIDHLALDDYALVGHSLGGRTVLRTLVRGASPRCAVVSGQGLVSVTAASQNVGWMRDFLSAYGTGVFEPGSDEQETEAWMHTTGADPRALLRSLDSYLDTSPEELTRVTVPTLVLTGRDDWQNATAPALADALGRGHHLEVPGDHFSAKARPEFIKALVDFLCGQPCQHR